MNTSLILLNLFNPPVLFFPLYSFFVLPWKLDVHSDQGWNSFGIPVYFQIIDNLWS